MEPYPNFRSLRLKKATKSARMKSKKAFKDKKSSLQFMLVTENRWLFGYLYNSLKFASEVLRLYEIRRIAR